MRGFEDSSERFNADLRAAIKRKEEQRRAMLAAQAQNDAARAEWESMTLQERDRIDAEARSRYPEATAHGVPWFIRRLFVNVQEESHVQAR